MYSRSLSDEITNLSISFMNSTQEEMHFLCLYILNQHATLYRDFAAGVGRDPLACCLEILVACPRAVLAAD
jgi:hypothetical protein